MQLILNRIKPKAHVLVVPHRRMTEDEYWNFCQANPDLRIERTAAGEIEIMPPTGIQTGYRNSDLNRQLGNWAERNRRGRAFDSNTEFILPNGAARAPDASWVAGARLAALTREQTHKFGPLCPDFVVELTSPSDRLKKVQTKMREYIDNGARLGWLLDTSKRTAYIYRPGLEVDKLVAPKELVGEGPVAGFILDLEKIWEQDLWPLSGR